MKKQVHGYIFFLVFTSLFLYLPTFIITHAQQASGCAMIKVGNPPANEQLPPGCAGGGNQKVVELARAQIGKGFYISGQPSRNWATEDPNAGKTPEHFDCSGLAGWAWYWGSGGTVNMLGQTASDWGSGNFNQHSPNEPLQPGDLIYWDVAPGNIHHTGIYEGTGGCGANDCFIEAYSDGKPVRENSVAKAASYMKMAGFLRPGEKI
jgi:cell wall-associated NlpC family hydrolase